MDTLFIGSILFNIINSFVWLLVPICLIIQVFGIKLYRIIDERKTDVILRKLKVISANSVYYNSEFKPHSLFFSWYCIGNIYLTEINRRMITEIYIITTKEYIDNLMKDPQDEIISLKGDSSKKITIYNRRGNFYHLSYEESSFSFNKNIMPNQNTIVHAIIKFYRDYNYCTSFISGAPGSGKTTIAYFLAKELNGCICKTFNPTDPGDEIIELIRTVNPTPDKPLIVLLDEIDIMISKIHDNKIDTHKNVPVPVRSKTDFNRFLDDIEIHCKNTIFILTSNLSKDVIDANTNDKSYLRDGRVNRYFTL